MLPALVVIAASIMLIYFFYFLGIIKGNPEVFEFQILKTMAGWIVRKGPNSRTLLWTFLFLSAIIEAAYFLVVFTVMQNRVIIGITIFLAVFEFVHLALVAKSLASFFGGKITLKKIFKWRMERSSALFFFTHAFLIIITLIWT